jgi:hypothetical protein
MSVTQIARKQELDGDSGSIVATLPGARCIGVIWGGIKSEAFGLTALFQPWNCVTDTLNNVADLDLEVAPSTLIQRAAFDCYRDMYADLIKQYPSKKEFDLAMRVKWSSLSEARKRSIAVVTNSTYEQETSPIESEEEQTRSSKRQRVNQSSRPFGMRTDMTMSWLFCPLIHSAMGTISDDDARVQYARNIVGPGLFDELVALFENDFAQRGISPIEHGGHIRDDDQERLLLPTGERSGQSMIAPELGLHVMQIIASIATDTTLTDDEIANAIGRALFVPIV